MKALETTWNGYRFRSRCEARWSIFFDKAGIRFEYEKEGVALPSGPYLPDFWLPDLDVWFEVKGVEPTGRESALCAELSLASGKKTLLAIGPPSPSEQILVWDAGEQDQTRFYFAEDRRNTGVFWLTSECSGYGLGDGPFCNDRHPGVFTKTQRAYDASRAERFDGKPRVQTGATPEGIAAARRLRAKAEASRAAGIRPKSWGPPKWL
jgi:hypothetical protein